MIFRWFLLVGMMAFGCADIKGMEEQQVLEDGYKELYEEYQKVLQECKELEKKLNTQGYTDKITYPELTTLKTAKPVLGIKIETGEGLQSSEKERVKVGTDEQVAKNNALEDKAYELRDAIRELQDTIKKLKSFEEKKEIKSSLEFKDEAKGLDIASLQEENFLSEEKDLKKEEPKLIDNEQFFIVINTDNAEALHNVLKEEKEKYCKFFEDDALNKTAKEYMTYMGAAEDGSLTFKIETEEILAKFPEKEKKEQVLQLLEEKNLEKVFTELKPSVFSEIFFTRMNNNKFGIDSESSIDTEAENNDQIKISSWNVTIQKPMNKVSSSTVEMDLGKDFFSEGKKEVVEDDDKGKEEMDEQNTSQSVPVQSSIIENKQSNDTKISGSTENSRGNLKKKGYNENSCNSFDKFSQKHFKALSELKKGINSTTTVVIVSSNSKQKFEKTITSDQGKGTKNDDPITRGYQQPSLSSSYLPWIAGTVVTVAVAATALFLATHPEARKQAMQKLSSLNLSRGAQQSVHN